MPVLVKCDCGHEITVADSMAGKKGRCPKCDSILSIPRKGHRRPRGGAFTPVSLGSNTSSYRTLSFLATLLSLIGLVGLFFFAGIGVYTGVTAFRGSDAFHGPFGFFEGYKDLARDQATMVGVAFILGGLLVGCLTFVFLSAAAQVLKLFITVERSLLSITDQLGRKD